MNSFTRLLVKCAVIIVACFILFTFVIGVKRVNGNSMYPALRDGDLCITYKLGKISANDVVVYRQGIETKTRIGRAVAFYGSVVDISGGSLMLNGVPAAEKVTYATEKGKGAFNYPYSIEPDHYFVLNDFREDTEDSRDFGTIEKKNIKGHVIFVLRIRDF